MNWFKLEYSSWFIDNFVLQGDELLSKKELQLLATCEHLMLADGGMIASTPFDPVFLLLPMLMATRGNVSIQQHGPLVRSTCFAGLLMPAALLKICLNIRSSSLIYSTNRWDQIADCRG